jgi:hypothetical protein
MDKNAEESMVALSIGDVAHNLYVSFLCLSPVIIFGSLTGL